MSKGTIAPHHPPPDPSTNPPTTRTTTTLPSTPILAEDASSCASSTPSTNLPHTPPDHTPVPNEINIDIPNPDNQAINALNNSTHRQDPTIYSLFDPLSRGRNNKTHRTRQKNELHNTHVGDVLAEKTDTTTRCYSQNQNGVNLKDKGHQFKEICEDTLLIQADIRSMIEHNLDTTNMHVRQTCLDIAKQTFSHFALEMTSSTIPFLTTYKPGGTMVLTHDNITGRITHKHSDPLGRWTHLQFAGKNGRVLNHITAYQVCPRPTNKKGTTAFHQQESLLRLQGNSDTNPRRNFRNDLIKFLKPMKTRDEHIILCGDFNEPLDAGSSNMAKICQDIGLADVFAIRHPDLPEPATHIRGSRRIDYFLVSESVLPAVTAVRYDRFNSASRPTIVACS
jgi:hypothetical protein